MKAPYIARALSSVPDILETAARMGPEASPTAFQAVEWLRHLYDGLAPAMGAEPLAVCVENADHADCSLLLPLIIKTEGAVRIASFPDLGVSDYGAPLLGRAVSVSQSEAELLWSTVKAAVDADVIRLFSMSRSIGSRINPLAFIREQVPSKHSANRLTLKGSVEDFLRERGKKYRKEVERCFRLLAREGEPRFVRAETANDIMSSYLVLQTQQSARHQGKGSKYALDQPAYSKFYERLLRSGVPHGFAHIFKLSAGDEIVAALLGVTHGGTFTLLRISNGGTRWQHLSPGRLVVIEAMKYFVARGIRSFDMGIGDYPFKRGFGIEPEPLVDVVAALSWRGVPAALLHHTKSRARRSRSLTAVANRLRGGAN